MPNEGAQNIQELLEKQRLQDELREAWRLGRWEFQNAEEEQEKRKSWKGTPEWKRVQPLLMMHEAFSDEESSPSPWVPPEARHAFEKRILWNLSRPATVTADDLVDAFEHHLLANEAEFEEAYPLFVQSVMAEMEYREGGVLPLADYSVVDYRAEELVEDFRGEWAEGGFRIEFFSQGEPGDPEWITTLRARFLGECTEKAMEAFLDEARDVIGSILQSHCLCVPALTEDAIEELGHGSSAPVCICGAGDEWMLCHALQVAHRLLTTYFTSNVEAGKGHISFRIRNGLGYLAEADRHKPGALHMLLSVAALEALIGHRSDKGITDKLANRCAILLEPDKQKRRRCAEFVRGLYEKRSSIIHGRDFKAPTRYAVEARRLAAGVLLEVQEWADFMKRMGKKPCDDELRKELEEASYEARPVDGLLGSTDCRDLWS